MSVILGCDNIFRQLLLHSLTSPEGAAWLFTGQAGLGKSKTAMVISHYLINGTESLQTAMQELLSDSEDDGGKWLSYINRIERGQIFGVKYLKGYPERPIPIDQVREIKSFVSVEPGTKTGKRVIIIDAINYMSAATQHVLLKALEDNLSNSYFIIIAHEEHNVLPTVLSRCVPVPFYPLSAENMKLIFKRLGLHLGEQEAINKAILSAGNMKDGIFLFRALTENTKLWQAHLNLWTQLLTHSLRDTSWVKAMDKLLTIGELEEAHIFLFLWQLRRIINFIFCPEVVNMTLCDQEEQLRIICLQYSPVSWIAAANSVFDSMTSLVDIKYSIEVKLILLLSKLRSRLELIK